jgi:MFS-type transporter involved in bile tolerance (Atg22 family)
MDLGATAQKWAIAIVGIFVLGTLATVLFPLITEQFADNGALDNATGNSYTSLLGAVPTLLIIVFIIALVIGVVAMLSFRKNR